MSMDLINSAGDEFAVSTLGWAFSLSLAGRYDWQPAGTEPPSDWDVSASSWEGHYDWNAGQTVTAEDAASLAAALERYLADPKGESAARSVARELGDVIRNEVGGGADVAVALDARMIDTIKSLIGFARRGAFLIW